MAASVIERIRSRRWCAAVRSAWSESSLPTSTGSMPRSGIGLLALGRGRAQRGADLLAGAVMLAGLGVGLGHRDRLAERAAALGGDHVEPGTGRALEHDVPFLRGEIGLAGHVGSSVSGAGG